MNFRDPKTIEEMSKRGWESTHVLTHSTDDEEFDIIGMAAFTNSNDIIDVVVTVDSELFIVFNEHTMVLPVKSCESAIHCAETLLSAIKH